MILKTQEIKSISKQILLAVDNNAANLELKTLNNYLYLNVTNKEYYVSVKYELSESEEFRATVSAILFLDLISAITTDTFELNIKDNTVILKSGKSSYKLPMIYENDKIMELPVIKIENKTVAMQISNDILQSIVNVNGQEIKKTKNVDANELQKLYYLTNEGCFTFTTGACLNKFTLEKPIKLLLNDRLVKLFKLFKSDVNFTLGYDALPNGQIQTKISLIAENVYLASIITNDDILISKVQGPCTATQNFINEKYSHSLVLSVNQLNDAISRLMLFTKHSIDKANMMYIVAKLHISNNELTITDRLANSESVMIENGSYVENEYDLKLNLFDLKLVLDSCKDEHITLNCGNGRSIVLTRGAISNLIPECKRD